MSEERLSAVFGLEEVLSLLNETEEPAQDSRPSEAEPLAGSTELAVSAGVLEEVAPSTEATAGDGSGKSPNSLNWDGTKWLVRYEGSEFLVTGGRHGVGLLGMRAIAFLLAKPGEWIGAAGIEAAANKQPVREGQRIRYQQQKLWDLHREIRLLESQIETATGQARMEMEERLPQLKTILKTKEDRWGMTRPEMDPQETARKCVARNIKTIYSYLSRTEGARQFAKHLITSLKLGTDLRYRPEKDPGWKLQDEFAKWTPPTRGAEQHMDVEELEKTSREVLGEDESDAAPEE
jgi:hypothetical protein